MMDAIIDKYVHASEQERYWHKLKLLYRDQMLSGTVPLISDRYAGKITPRLTVSPRDKRVIAPLFRDFEKDKDEQPDYGWWAV